ncbi:hypothetical protein HKCCE2091_17695 [Rhodobacterales bacterium HKCCE2091]|nr:hypothetical protein [Rhodobacterales bacterium HKCCE2091]
MTNTVALWILGCLIALLLADTVFFHWHLPTLFGREFLNLIDWLAFWR